MILTRFEAPLQEDIGRLDIAMDQSLSVGRGQAAGDLVANPNDVLDLERPDPIELLLQGFPGDVLHDQVRDREIVHGVDVDHVLVADRGGGPRLAEEPLAGRRGRAQGPGDRP